MSNCGTATQAPTRTRRTADAVLRTTEWSNAADASGPILRRAAAGALLRDDRIQVAYDHHRGEYVLGISSSR